MKLLRWAASLSCILLSVPPALAQSGVLIPLSQDRRASSWAKADNFVTFLHDSEEEIAADYGPFVSAVDSSVSDPGASASGGSTHESEILPNGLRTRGAVFATANVQPSNGWYAEGSGSARCELEFEVTKKSTFSLSGSYAAYDTAWASLYVSGGGLEIYEDTYSSDGQVDYQRVVDPGTFTFRFMIAAGAYIHVLDYDYGSGDYDLELLLTPLSDSYCSSAPNSVGSGAVLDFSGSQDVSDDDFQLTVSGSVPDQPGIFYYGTAQVDLPFGDGRRCVGGTIFRLPPNVADAGGFAERAIPLGGVAPGAILPGSTWNFQWWYRDPGGAAGFNTSQGIEVDFFL